jgi:hypothetical protein
VKKSLLLLQPLTPLSSPAPHLSSLSMENHVESMEGSSPSLDLGEELQRVLEQFTTPNPPMDAQIHTKSNPDMKIFEQKTTQE